MALNAALVEEEVPLEEPQPQGMKFQDREIDEHPELVNLAKYMDPKELDILGQQCYEEFKQDEESRSDWLDMQAEWVKLYYGKNKPKNPPWDGASDDHLPILAEGCVQFHARAYKAFFASQNFVSAIATGAITGDDQNRADRIGKYMSWQLGVADKTYKRRKDRLLKALPLHGSYFTKTYRDNINRKIVVENVSPLDLVANYSSTGVDVDELERKTHCIYIPPRLGRYYGSEATNNYFLHPPEESLYTKNPAREVIENVTGVKEPTRYVGGKPAKILEQHRWLDLDNDGIEEPYLVTIDESTQKVLRIAIRWSWDDWMKKQSKEPLEYFTHYVYIENPDGFYGFGQGHLVGDTNIACDKMLRQVIDAATIQNARPGFATQQAALKSGELRIQPGVIKKLNASGKIQDMMAWMDHPGPSEALWRAMMLLTQRADRLNMVTDMLTGQPEKVYQTGTASMLVEQGLMTFSAVQIRVHAALEQELQKIFRLNGMFLDDQTYFVFNDGQTEQQYEVFRSDFSSELQVRPAFDPHQLTEKERKQQAMIEYEAALKNPVIARSPEHVLNATRRFFQAIGAVNVSEIVPDVQQIMAMQQKTQAMQGAMMQAEAQEKQANAKTAAVEAQTSMVEAKTKQAIEAKKLQQKDRELNLKEDELRLKAAVEAADDRLEKSAQGLEAIRVANEIKQSKESDD